MAKEHHCKEKGKEWGTEEWLGEIAQVQTNEEFCMMYHSDFLMK